MKKKYKSILRIILWSIAILAISICLSSIIPESTKAKSGTDTYKRLKIFEQIDRIAHQREAVLLQSNNNYNRERDRLFQRTDNEYHSAQEIDKKSKETQKLNTLIIQQDTFFLQKGYVDIAGDATFLQLEEEFNQISWN